MRHVKVEVGEFDTIQFFVMAYGWSRQRGVHYEKYAISRNMLAGRDLQASDVALEILMIMTNGTVIIEWVSLE